MKFADFVHAAKQNPVTDVPQATIAHDNAWDYIANNRNCTFHHVAHVRSGPAQKLEDDGGLSYQCFPFCE